jgi:hypothetical protein
VDDGAGTPVGVRWFTDATLGPVQQFFSGSTLLTENHAIYAADPKLFTIDNSGSQLTCQTWDDAGLITYANLESCRPRVTRAFDAGELAVDGTNCTAATETVNSWPNTPTVVCADNNASVMYLRTAMPANWASNTDVVLTVCVYSPVAQGATETIALDPVCTCVNDGNQLGTPPAQATTDQISFDMGNQTNDVQCGTSPGITPGGSCSAGSTLWCAIYVDAAAWDETPASDIRIVTGRLDAFLATSR